MLRPATPTLAVAAFVFWRNARTARQLAARGDLDGFLGCLEVVEATATVSRFPSLRRAAASTFDSLAGAPLRPTPALPDPFSPTAA